MSDRRFAIILIIFGLFLFSACARANHRLLVVENAEDEGILMPYEAVIIREIQLARAIIQDITAEANFGAQIVFSNVEHLYLQRTHGELTILAEAGQHVNKGDVLAYLTFETDARADANYLTAARRLERLEENFTREHNERLSQISDARARIAGLEGNARRRALLELELLEVVLERFLLTGRIDRDAAKDELERVERTLGVEEIIAPFDGMISFVTNDPDNVTRNPRIFTIVNYDNFFFQINVGTGAEINYNTIGYGDIITLRAEGGGFGFDFDAQIVTDTWATGRRQGSVYWLKPVDKEGLFEAARHNGDNPMFSLLNSRITARAEFFRATDSIAVPREAVGYDGRGNFVYVYSDGRQGKRYVSIGESDHLYYQILYGLEPGTQVVISP